MKKATLIFSLLTLSFSIKAQVHQIPKVTGNFIAYNNAPLSTGIGFTNNDPVDSLIKDYAYYIQKSKNQRVGGLVLLGSGVLLSGIGLLIAQNSNLDEIEGGVIIMGLGALSGLISIPIMIMAHANKNKAKLMLSRQKTGLGVPSNWSQNITGVTITIPIGK